MPRQVVFDTEAHPLLAQPANDTCGSDQLASITDNFVLRPGALYQLESTVAWLKEWANLVEFKVHCHWHGFCLVFRVLNTCDYYLKSSLAVIRPSINSLNPRDPQVDQ